MDSIVLLGRILLAAIFIAASPRHFTREAITHAAELGVPLAAVTVEMHAFWRLSDPLAIHTQQAMFMKNLAMLGALLVLSQTGSGERQPNSLKTQRDFSRQRLPRN